MSFTTMGMCQKTCSLYSPGLEEEAVSLGRSCHVLPAGILHCIHSLLCDNSGPPLQHGGQYMGKGDRSVYICI